MGLTLFRYWFARVSNRLPLILVFNNFDCNTYVESLELLKMLQRKIIYQWNLQQSNEHSQLYWTAEEP